LYYDQARYKEAEPLYRRALEIAEKSLGPEHPYTSQILNNLILFYRKQGKNAEADALEKSAKEKAK
jgi:tetratricopeptide (TPR) repeat protein